MKVRALLHVYHVVGSLSVERPYGTEFELDDDSAVKAIAAGLVTSVSAPVTVKPKTRYHAKNRETK